MTGPRLSAALRSTAWRALLVGGPVLLAVMVAPPLSGGSAGAAAPPSATCPSQPASANVQVAGYNLSAQAQGVRYALASPGLLPTGDPHEGTIMEFDVPFARDTVSEGPVIDSLGSPAYPGDTAAHLGSAVATFGGPPLPNDPVLAEAGYPPAPGVGTSAQFGPSGGGTSASSASAKAGPQGGSAQATAASTSFAPGSGAAVASADSSTATTKIDIATACVSSAAQSTSGAVNLAGGLIHIGGITGTASALSDGSHPVGQAHLSVGRVTVGGLAAYIDHDGIHLAGQQPLGYGVVAQVQAALNSALQSSGMAVKLIDPVISKTGEAASADSGGIEVTIDRYLPATGVPGVPAITVPGQAPIPVGTPPLPLHIEVIYGAAKASADATTAPAPGSLPLPTPALPGGPTGSSPGASGTTSPGGLPGGTDIGSGPSSGAVSGPGTSPALSLARSTAPPTSGAPIPVGWIIIGVVGSLIVAGPLFGYARWQLLEGRI